MYWYKDVPFLCYTEISLFLRGVFTAITEQSCLFVQEDTQTVVK